MKPLLMGKPVKINTKTAPNRIVYHPCECNDADTEGNPTKLTLERYRGFAEGGPGIIFVEAVKVTNESHGRTRDLWGMKQNIKGLSTLVETIREVNPEILILFQISHDGRRSGRFSRAVSVYPTDDPSIHLLTTDELIAIEDMFAETAWVVEQAGGDGIDLKSCNGYLGAEVLRPANKRTDGYGGSFENRTRFFRETVEKMKSRVSKSFILGARISRETIPGGIGSSGSEGSDEDLTEFIDFARLMEREGMHYVSIHVSNATYFAETWVQMPTDKNPEDVFVHFRLTGMIKEAVSIPVMGAGYSYLGNGKNKLQGGNPEKKSFTYWAEKNLKDGATDILGVGRQSLADHLFAKKILEGKNEEINYCRTCQGCFKLVVHQEQAGCVVYDKHYKELYRRLNKKLKTEKDSTSLSRRA